MYIKLPCMKHIWSKNIWNLYEYKPHMKLEQFHILTYSPYMYVYICVLHFGHTCTCISILKPINTLYNIKDRHVSGFCHFGLVLVMVLWQNPDTPVMSCFYVCVCVPCFLLEHGVWIPALMSWVSVLCQGSDTRAPCSVLLCERAVSSSLGRTLFSPHVLCFV